MSKVEKAVEVLNDGGVVVFPTDTVWGVGASVASSKGIEALYRVKGRDEFKPTAILVSGMHMAEKYGVFDQRGWSLAMRYWPGAVTLIVEARVENVPMKLRAGGDSVGLRVPDHKLCVEVIERLGQGVAASSANFAGGIAPSNKKMIDPLFLNKVDLIIEGEAGNKSSSTVIDTRLDELAILRRGDVKIS